jgi:hypothetical protein
VGVQSWTSPCLLISCLEASEEWKNAALRTVLLSHRLWKHTDRILVSWVCQGQ